MIFVYSLNYFLFPRYVLKGKFFSGFIVFLLILAVSLAYARFADVCLVHYSGNTKIWGRYNWPRVIWSLFSIGWIAVTIRLVKKWYVEKEVQHRLEKEKLTVELQLLRSQLHPHFLFNTLNSLYSMTLERSAEAPEAVLQLSSLLRYILYECNDPVVPLSQEIKSQQSDDHTGTMTRATALTTATDLVEHIEYALVPQYRHPRPLIRDAFF